MTSLINLPPEKDDQFTSQYPYLEGKLLYQSNNTIDVLALNETRLDSTVGDNEVHIHGYDIVRRDRNSNGRFGGGVCFYIRSCINFLVRQDLCLEQLENLCILVNKPRAKPFLISYLVQATELACS